MKKFIILIFSLLITINSITAQKLSCCQLAAHADDMAQFICDPAFIVGHEAPLDFKYQGKGEIIVFNTPDENKARAFEIKAAKPSNKYLLVFQEWWGLNDYIKKESERYYDALGGKVNVIALDMYDGKVATDANTAGKYMGECKTERLDAITQGAFLYCGKDAKIASIGWCFGGGRSLQAALLGGKSMVGCVMFYGMPEKDIDKLKTLNCDVLGLFAAREKWISPEVVAQFEKDMASAGKKIKIKNFDAAHAFANPSNPHFDKEKSDEAFKMALKYLKKRLK